MLGHLKLCVRFLFSDDSRIWPFYDQTNWLEKGRYFFYEHGGKSFFRSISGGPFTRLHPVTAGALHVSVTRFLITDTSLRYYGQQSAVIPGVLLGAASLELPPDIAAAFYVVCFESHY